MPRTAQSKASAGELLRLIMGAAHAIEQQLEAVLALEGLSMAKYIALSHLAEAGDPLSLSECANRMTCVRSNITQLMDRLETDGLVRRVEDPADRRAVRAALTPLGIERQAAGTHQVEKAQKALAKKLSAADCNALERALSAIK